MIKKKAEVAPKIHKNSRETPAKYECKCVKQYYMKEMTLFGGLGGTYRVAHYTSPVAQKTVNNYCFTHLGRFDFGRGPRGNIPLCFVGLAWTPLSLFALGLVPVYMVTSIVRLVFNI